MIDLITISFFCSFAFASPDGTAVLQDCVSVDSERKPAFLVGHEEDLGAGICRIKVYGTISTSWPNPIPGYTICSLLKED